MNASAPSDRWPFPADQQAAPSAPRQQPQAPRAQAAQYHVPGQQRPQHAQHPAPGARPAQTQRTAKAPTPVGRRLLGVVALLVLTGLSLPMHAMTIFFVYLQVESPGDTASAILIIGGTFLGSFVALLITGVLSQVIGGFPSLWRTRIALASISAVLSIVIAYVGALTLF